MPPKVRELVADLENAGFADRGGKGSHRNFMHPRVSKPITISGKLGDDRQSLPDKSHAARARGSFGMKDSARYVKIVEWSGEDQCYVGSAPGLILGGFHGDDERQVFAELCQVVMKPSISTVKTGGPCRLRPQVTTSPIRCTGPGSSP
jgi:predicted RNA binding protein YcfA (HicA-like mRNA interferase family)